MLFDLPPTEPLDGSHRIGLRRCTTKYRDEYVAYYERNAMPESPAMRGADPAIVLVPGVGMFSFATTAAEARIAGEFYVNAINVMRGAEALSTYAPVSEAEKFRIEYWALEEAKLAAAAKAQAADGSRRVGDGRGVRYREGDRRTVWRARAPK